MTPIPALAALIFLASALPAQAYIGPGLGAGAVAAVLGVVGSVLLGVFAVVYYPIKRALRKRRAAKPERDSEKKQ
ncbi:hypothetical protein [Pararhizobium haloflavum]|uniref:hypothetical protein n=1 Tax=Pararhizobium haloflavum TaxID=2037914 RepID=UPI000C184003|nr:hypothetical protein [Pararhizobium haloflavum]